MTNPALIIGGGGSKGAFAVGVLKYLFANRPGIRFDTVCATSAGALIAPLAALREIDELERLHTTIRTSDILLRGNLVERVLQHASLYDTRPLAALVSRVYTQARYDRLVASGVNLFLATVSLQTQRLTYFSTRDAPPTSDYDVIRVADRGEFLRAVVASTSQPVLMPPIEIRSSGSTPRQYVDGGVRELLPIRVALDNGATDLLIVSMSPETTVPTNVPYVRVESALLRTLDTLLEDVQGNDLALPQLYNQALEYIRAVRERVAEKTGLPAKAVEALFDVANNPFAGKRPVNLHLIRPRTALATDGGLEFNPAEMKARIVLGEAAAREYFEKLSVV